MLAGGLANVMSLSVIRESVKCSWSGFPSLEPEGKLEEPVWQGRAILLHFSCRSSLSKEK